MCSYQQLAANSNNNKLQNTIWSRTSQRHPHPPPKGTEMWRYILLLLMADHGCALNVLSQAIKGHIPPYNGASVCVLQGLRA